MPSQIGARAAGVHKREYISQSANRFGIADAFVALDVPLDLFENRTVGTTYSSPKVAASIRVGGFRGVSRDSWGLSSMLDENLC